MFVGGELVFGFCFGIGTRTGFEKYSSDQGDSSNLYTQFDYYYADKDTHFNAFARHNIDEKQSINGTDTTRSYGNYGVRVERVLSRGVT